MKKILLAMVVIAAAASVHASYLYWQIDSSDVANAVSQGAPSDITGVRIFASNNGGDTKTYLNLSYIDDSGNLAPIGYAVSAPLQGGSLVADVSAFESGTFSFYVELINNNLTYWNEHNESAYQHSSVGGFAGQLQGADISYSSLKSAEYIGADLSPIRMAVWHGGGSYSPVPEPTSAMLVLIGLAGLALKRRAV